MELLKIQGLKMNYGAVAALKGIDLTVSEGQIVALLGANGAGKTTTLKAVSGLLKPTGGEILFEGENIAGRNAHQIARRGIMQSPEGRHVLLGLSVEENLRAGAHTLKTREINGVRVSAKQQLNDNRCTAEKAYVNCAYTVEDTRENLIFRNDLYSGN